MSSAGGHGVFPITPEGGGRLLPPRSPPRCVPCALPPGRAGRLPLRQARCCPQPIAGQMRRGRRRGGVQLGSAEVAGPGVLVPALGLVGTPGCGALGLGEAGCSGTPGRESARRRRGETGFFLLTGAPRPWPGCGGWPGPGGTRRRLLPGPQSRGPRLWCSSSAGLRPEGGGRTRHRVPLLLQHCVSSGSDCNPQSNQGSFPGDNTGSCSLARAWRRRHRPPPRAVPLCPGWDGDKALPLAA